MMSYGSLGNPDDSPEMPYTSTRKDLVGSDGGRVLVESGGSSGAIPEPNLAFCDVSYKIPSSLFSRKKEKVILESIR